MWRYTNYGCPVAPNPLLTKALYFTHSPTNSTIHPEFGRVNTGTLIKLIFRWCNDVLIYAQGSAISSAYIPQQLATRA